MLARPAEGGKERQLGLADTTGGLQIGLQIGFEIVLAGHGVELAALFVEPHPEPVILDKHVRDLHGHRRRNPGEGENQNTDQSAVALTYDLCRVDAVENAACLIRR